VLKKIQFQPDIIHANDWHTGIVPYYLKSLFKSDPFFAKIKTVFTIHNIGYQGVFEKSDIQEAGIPPRDLDHDFLMWGKVNLMKVGTVYADVITTVSEKYSKEIQSPEYGHGLEVIIRSRASDLYGIINGVDYSIWNPSTDPLIPANYSVDDLTGKKKCKEFLQKKLNLKVSPAPIIAIISRLDYQKGLDLVLDVFDDMMALNVQFVLLGTGDKKLEREFAKKAEKYSSRCSINIEFNNELAHQIEAGADIFLMPSRYEPCGLNQMYSMIYGTIPIVRKTGGLADTVIDYTENPNEGTGFVFEKYNNIELYDTVKKAVELYKHSPEEWQKLQTRAMSKDFSWQRTAIKIERIYKNLLN
ncbi:MAG: glycogen synthase, partial [Candidatus Heimdallarchaeaceae archaeon]